MAKKGIKAAIVVVAVIVIIGGVMMAIEFDEPILENDFDTLSNLGDGSGEGTFGEVRNCIRSVFGDDPECSDYSERVLDTFCNSRPLGPMPYSQARLECATQ